MKRIVTIATLTGALIALMLVLAVRNTPRTQHEQGLRIVALSPALAITLVDLGLQDAIVGRHGWDYVLEKSVPVCGDQSGIDFEVLLSTKPTHVLTEWGAQDLPARLDALSREHGWTVRDFSMLSLEEVSRSVVDLAALFPGRITPMRSELKAMSEDPAQLLDQMIPPSDAPYEGRVLLLWPTNPPAAVGPGSFHHELLLRVGGTPAIERGSAYIELDAEAIVSLAPDAIMLISPRSIGTPAAERDWSEIANLLGVVSTLDVAAIRNRRVGILDHPLALTPSTALIDLGEDMRRLLDAWTADGSVWSPPR